MTAPSLIRKRVLGDAQRLYSALADLGESGARGRRPPRSRRCYAAMTKASLRHNVQKWFEALTSSRQAATQIGLGLGG